MGKLRIEPKHKEPDFIRLVLDPAEQQAAPVSSRQAEAERNITIRTKRGTQIQIGRTVPLRQVARLVKILEGRGNHDLG